MLRVVVPNRNGHEVDESGVSCSLTPSCGFSLKSRAGLAAHIALIQNFILESIFHDNYPFLKRIFHNSGSVIPNKNASGSISISWTLAWKAHIHKTIKVTLHVHFWIKSNVGSVRHRYYTYKVIMNRDIKSEIVSSQCQNSWPYTVLLISLRIIKVRPLKVLCSRAWTQIAAAALEKSLLIITGASLMIRGINEEVLMGYGGPNCFCH